MIVPSFYGMRNLRPHRGEQKVNKEGRGRGKHFPIKRLIISCLRLKSGDLRAV
jgi:hypothetical protein